MVDDGDAEDALQLPEPGRFALEHRPDSARPIGLFQQFGHRGMDGAEIRVAADVVVGHGLDDVPPAPLLQGAGLLADDVECPGDALLGHDLGQPFGDVVDPLGRRRDVVLDVEIDDEEHFGFPRDLRRDLPSEDELGAKAEDCTHDEG